MKRSPKFLVHVLLNTNVLTDKERDELVASIAQNAPQSDLFKNNPSIQVAVAELTKAGEQTSKSSAAVAGAEGLLSTLRQTRENDRAAFDRSLTLLKGLVENRGTTDADAKAMGFTVREFKGKAVGVVTPPDGVITTLAKQHGKFTATTHDLLGRKHFAAQISADPVAPNGWTDVPGNGRQRRFSGYASGSVQWVRFAALRGQQRSDWCAPVAVVVP